MSRHSRSFFVIYAVVFAALSVFGANCVNAQAFPTWVGFGSWSNNGNWSNGNASTYGQLQFTGSGNPSSNNDTGFNHWRVYFSGNQAYSLTGNSLSLFDFNGQHSWVLSDSSANQNVGITINFAATAGANFAQISSRNSGRLDMSGVNITGSQVGQLRIVSEGPGGVNMNGIISGSGKSVSIGMNESGNLFPNRVVRFNNANTYSGDTLVLAGALEFGQNGSSNNSILRLGDTTGSNEARVRLNHGSGGQSLSNVWVIRPGSSGIKTIESQNSSGTNTLGGNIFLDAGLTIEQNPGGTLQLTGSQIDIKQQTLTINTSGTVNISGTLSSSFGAGGSLIKQGAGTLVLSSSSNNYTGTNNNSLNASGTQIQAGTLAITSDTALGIAPQSAYNNIQFIGSGTLRSDATIALSANRNISISGGSMATFNSNGNSLTINGVINGAGNVTKTGNGSVTLNGNNLYSGSTTISGGTLIIGTNRSTGTTGSPVNVNLGSTLEVNGQLTASNVNVNNGKLMGTGSIIGDTNLSSNGTVAPGNSIGTLLVTGGVTLNSGAIFEWEFDGSSADFLRVNGVVNLGGATLTRLGSSFPVVGTKYSILAYTGTLLGQFAGIADNSVINNQWLINYADNVGGSNGSGAGYSYVTVTAVPDPTAILLVGSLASLAGFKRRRGRGLSCKV